MNGEGGVSCSAALLGVMSMAAYQETIRPTTGWGSVGSCEPGGRP